MQILIIFTIHKQNIGILVCHVAPLVFSYSKSQINDMNAIIQDQES